LKAAVYILAAFFFVPAGAALGNEVKLTPSVTVHEEYNDNIFFSAENQKGDFLTRIAPALTLTDRSERLEAAVSVAGNGIVYAKENGPNSIDQQYSAQMRYLTTPRSTVSLHAGYTVDSQPDRDLGATGFVIDAVKRHRQQYSIGEEMTLTEKVGAQLSYSYQQDEYDKEGMPWLKYHDVTLTASHNLDRLLRATTGSVVVGYAHYESASSSTSAHGGLVSNQDFGVRVDNMSVALGASSAFTEIWSIQGNVGGRYTISRFFSAQRLFFGDVPLTDGRSSHTSREWGVVGELRLLYAGERSSASLTFNTDVMPSSGQNSGTTVRTSVAAEGSYRLTYDLTGVVTAGYFRNRSNPGAETGQVIDQDTVFISPAVRYQLDKDIYLEGSYQYNRLFNNVTHADSDRNSVFVRVVVQHPFFL